MSSVTQLPLFNNLEPQLKCCPQCGEVFPLTSEYWNRNKTKKDGLADWCKQCSKAQYKKWKQENIDTNKEYNRHYRQKNLERMKEKRRQEYHANPEKAKEEARRWREENPEKKREMDRHWQQENPEKKRESDRRWRENNQETCRTNRRNWQENNREIMRESGRRFRRNNLESVRAKNRKWQKENPEKTRAKWHRRRAHKLQAEGYHTAEDTANIYRFQKGLCKYCGVDLAQGKHLDHIIPLSRGGNNWPTNLQYLCPHCNTSKGDKMPWEFKPEWYFK